MEHALHLAAKHFVEDVAPTSASELLRKVKGAMANATDEGEGVNLDTLNSELRTIEAEMSKEGGDGEPEEYDVANTVGKALALVTCWRGPLLAHGKHKSLFVIFERI